METPQPYDEGYNNDYTAYTPHDEDGEPVIYEDEHELGHTPRSMDEPPEPEPDTYLDASYEDRFDIGDSYEF